MINKDNLLDSIIRECTICQHLHGKIPPDQFDYRPSSSQRSMLDLLRYISMVGVGSVRFLLDGNWGAWGELGERARGMEAGGFTEAMDRQIEELRAIFGAISDDDFAHRIVRSPWGPEMALDLALLETTLKFFVAYRMQLFLYAKSAGAAEIGTTNGWMGCDESEPHAVSGDDVLPNGAGT